MQNNKSFNYKMLSRVVKTRKPISLNILLYSLPKI